jgi:hypothetical protein
MRLATILALAIALTGLTGSVAQAAPRDQIVVTGSAVVPKGATAKTVIVVDGPVTVAGNVTGDVVAVNGNVVISGTVDGTVTTIAKRAFVRSGGHVGGDIQYGDKKPDIAPGAQVSGDVTHENWDDISTGVQWLVWFVLWIAVTISTLILGLALLAFAPRAAAAAVRVSRERTGAACAWAAGLFFGVPILAIIAMVTVLGLPLGIALLLAYLPLTMVGYVTSCWLFGEIVGRKRGWGPKRTFLVGWGAARLVALLPFAGGLLWVAASAYGLGVLLLAAWYSSRPERAERPTPAPVPATS